MSFMTQVSLSTGVCIELAVLSKLVLMLMVHRPKDGGPSGFNRSRMVRRTSRFVEARPFTTLTRDQSPNHMGLYTFGSKPLYLAGLGLRPRISEGTTQPSLGGTREIGSITVND